MQDAAYKLLTATYTCQRNSLVCFVKIFMLCSTFMCCIVAASLRNPFGKQVVYFASEQHHGWDSYKPRFQQAMQSRKGAYSTRWKEHLMNLKTKEFAATKKRPPTPPWRLQPTWLLTQEWQKSTKCKLNGHTPKCDASSKHTLRLLDLHTLPTQAQEKQLYSLPLSSSLPKLFQGEGIKNSIDFF